MSSLDRDKYAEVLRYLLSSEANNDKLGKVKLMKLLYYADFDHYAAHRQSLTGDRYFKLPYGPVPSKAEEILEDMCQRELLTIGQKPRYQYLRYVYRLPDGSYYREKSSLKDHEKATLDAVIAKWKAHSTQEIVTASHGEPAWQMADFGAPIPYSYALYRSQVCTQDEEIGLKESLSDS